MTPDEARSRITALVSDRNAHLSRSADLLDQIAEAMSEGQAAGLTYVELAALAGVDRSRVGQLIASVRKTANVS